jgi:hypothetical protein
MYGLWYKLVWDGANFLFYHSVNGLDWSLFATRVGYQPQYMGLVIYSNAQSTYADRKVTAKWFRVTEP